jgi:hypothetical protein
VAVNLKTNALFVWTYQQNQQSSSSVFLSQQTSEQCFQHNKPAKQTGCKLHDLLGGYSGLKHALNATGHWYSEHFSATR